MSTGAQNPSQILTSVVSRLSNATELTEITQIVAEAARALSGAEGATFVLRDNDKCYYADEHAISPLWKGKRFPLEACISGWSMLHREVVVIRDIYKDARIPHDAYRPTFVKSLCMVPIRVENPMGSIGNYWASEHIPTEEEIKTLQILANSTAVALENLELKQAVLLRTQESAGFKVRAKELETAIHSIAHDLKTPITAMTGFAELLRIHMANRLDDRTSGYVNSLIETGMRMSTQIERMLSLYRATEGHLKREDVDLSDMAMKIINELQAQVPNRNIHIEVEPNLHTFADPSLLQIVLENLLTNALKYSSKKPETHIRLGRAEKGPSTFYVQDNGDGFDSAQAHKLFQPMSRLHSDSEFSGTGLGLASVARIIELHGGQVRAEAQKSVGATFFFSIPKQA